MGVLSIRTWDRFGWLRAGFSSREGGASSAYGPTELNLGWTKEDAEEAVWRNRAALVAAMGFGETGELVTVRQVHGDRVRVVRGDGPWTTENGRAVLEGDGLMTAEPGKLLGIQTADCVPVLVADTRLRAVAGFHAGWRGTVARIVEKGVAEMLREFGSRPEDMVAAVGPAIGVCCFEVGTEVAERFRGEFANVESLMRESVIEGHAYVDLHEANRRQLVEAGVPVGAISVVGDCTACARTADGARAYFSHRAENGVTGRMMSAIGVVG